MSTSQAAFGQLHPHVQRWIAAQGWPDLRPIQAAAIPPILAADTDLIITAATAGGKTEAAFLPIFSQLATYPGEGIRVLGLSPLKALINDQQRRLSEIGDRIHIPVEAWHGDISSARKQKILKQPAGIVLITPESLEALLIKRGTQLIRLFADLQYLVIDEMHSFIGSERGRQLQSLMHRLELAMQRRLVRVGLSATLGDMSLAAEFLRPGQGDCVRLIQDQGSQRDVKLQVRGYLKTMPDFDDDPDLVGLPGEDEIAIATHLFQVLRGSKNLIFINSRRQVEQYADLLRSLSIDQRTPLEFWPHHGSLAKELRQTAEDALRTPDRPANVICTMTLEMGIDVGAVQSIAQVGPPSSVASTCQRLGRSGRRAGEPAIMRCYISEPAPTDAMPLLARLCPNLVQSIAVLNLLIAGWFEPPITGQLHLSTLIQQLLSMIAQHNGLQPEQAWQCLCQQGPFTAVDPPLFMQLLRTLGTQDWLQQSQDGLLLLGLKGERLVNHYSFYTAFATVEDYRLIAEEQTLGTLPVEAPLVEGMNIIFAGRRWQILSVDDHRRVIEVESALAGKALDFGGSKGVVHEQLRQEMRQIYESEQVPAFLDRTAQELLNSARSTYRTANLMHQAIVDQEPHLMLFPWRGSRIMNTLLVQLLDCGLRVQQQGMALRVNHLSPEQLQRHLVDLVAAGPADPLALAATVKNKRTDKYDYVLSDELLCHNYAASHLDVVGAWQTLSQLCDDMSQF